MTNAMAREDIIAAAVATSTLDNKKKWARRLVRDCDLKQHEALDLIAQASGHRNWALFMKATADKDTR